MRSHSADVIYANKDTADAADILEQVLEEAGFENARKMQYVLSLEEALLKWRTHFPADEQVHFRRIDASRKTTLYVQISGEKCNPLLNDNEDDDITQLRKRIFSGCGIEFRFFYKKGTNTLRLVFPRTDAEARLFRWNWAAIAIPMAVQSTLLYAITATVTLLMGFIDKTTLAAVSLVGEFISLYSTLIDTSISGMGILVAQYKGKCDQKSIDDVLGFTIRLSTVISLCFFCAGMFFPDKVMSFYTDDAGMRQLGAYYLRGISLSFLMIPANHMYGRMLNINGKIIKSMVLSVSASLINLILLTLLVFGLFGLPRYGLTGAVIANITSNGVWLLAVIISIILSGRLLPLTKASFRFWTNQWKKFLSNTSMILMIRLAWILAMNLIASMFGHMGPDVTAAKAVAVTGYSLVLSIAGGLGQASGLFIGSDLGRGQLAQAERKSHWIMKLTVAAAFVNALLVVINTSLFSFLPMDLNDTAQYYYKVITIILAVRVIFATMNSTLSNGFLYAGGDIAHIGITDSFCYVVLGAGLGALLLYVLKAPVILCLFVLFDDEMTSFFFRFARFKKKKWLNNMTKE